MMQREMRAWCRAVAQGGGVLSAAFVAACSTGQGQDATPAGATTPATSAVASATAADGQGAGPNTSAAGAASAVSRCHTSDLSIKLGTNTGHTVALVWTNTSSRPCTMDGFGGVDLHGPADPNGPVDQLRRGPDPQMAANDPRATSAGKPTLVRLAPGGSAHTVITYATYQPGDEGTNGSTNWIPTEVVATPPDETTQLTTAWLPGVTVMRLDGATVESTFIGPVLPGAN